MTASVPDWRIVPSTVFTRQMRKLDPPTAKRINDYLEGVVASGEPRSRGKRLEGDLGEYWRYRIGDYRVICEIQDRDLVVLALRIGHRSEVYR